MAIKLARNTRAALLASTRVPEEGQPVVAIDTGETRIGNGVDQWKALPSFSSSVGQSLGYKIALDYGADPTGVADSTSALQDLLDDAGAKGVTAQAAGVFRTSGTLTASGDVDFTRSALRYTGLSSVAFQIGSPTSQLHSKTVRVGEVIATAKTGLGWGQVAGQVGVRASNCYSCHITVGRARNFETGFRVHAQPFGGNIQGTQHSIFQYLHLDNNKVNFHVAPHQGTSKADSGWANQNILILGRMSHNSNEGVQVPGVMHMDWDDCWNVVNGWTFLGTSVETPDVVEWHIRNAAQSMLLLGARFENTGGDSHRRILNRKSAKANMIIGGFNSGQLTQVNQDGAEPFRVISDTQATFYGGSATKPAVIMENQVSAAGPAWAVLRTGGTVAGDDPATAYVLTGGQAGLKGKRHNELFDRLHVDAVNGRIYVGDGTAAPISYLMGTGAFFLFGGASTVGALTDGGASLGGATNYRFNYIRAKTALQTGSFTTANRPAAATAGKGAMIFDETLGKTITSNGSAWVDAMGNPV
ncbi:hypothetical protein GCM10009616_35640 [Microlunatus lacustris]